MSAAARAEAALRAGLGARLAERLRAARSHAVRARTRARMERWVGSAPARAWRAALGCAPNIGETPAGARALAQRCEASAVHALVHGLEALDSGQIGLAGAAREPACARAVRALIEAKIGERAGERMLKETAGAIVRARWCARDRRIVAVSLSNLLGLTRMGEDWWRQVAGAPEWLKREALREPTVRSAPRAHWVHEAARARARWVGWESRRGPGVHAMNEVAERWRWRSPRPPLVAAWACAGEGRRPESDAAWAAMIAAQEEVWEACADGGAPPAPRAVAARVAEHEEAGPKALDAMLRERALALLAEALGGARAAREALATIERRTGSAADPAPTLVPADGGRLVRGCRWQVLHRSAARTIGAAKLHLGEGAAHDAPAQVREHALRWAGSLHDVHGPARWEGRPRGDTARVREHARALGAALGEVIG